MRGLEILDRVVEVDYSDTECIHELIEMQAADWLLSYKRLVRQQLAVTGVEFILESTSNWAQSIAAALRLADLLPSEECFKAACRLAQTSTIDQIESAISTIRDRDEFITAVLALVHYELFNEFELGQYVVRVEIVQQAGKVYRRYINP
jgi:hypothetical protein